MTFYVGHTIYSHWNNEKFHCNGNISHYVMASYGDVEKNLYGSFDK